MYLVGGSLLGGTWLGTMYSLRKYYGQTTTTDTVDPPAVQTEHTESYKQQQKREEDVLTLNEAAHKAGAILQRAQAYTGSPGLAAACSVNGKLVYQCGVGLADVENCVPCSSNTVMRIASVSKSITALLCAKLVEDGKLDLDQPVTDYVQSWPKTYRVQEVGGSNTKETEMNSPPITSRHLLSHLSGIRHYKRPSTDTDSPSTENDEFLCNKQYDNIEDALETFQNDALLSVPGKKFNYTTYGYTLLAVVMEKVANKKIQQQLKDFFAMSNMNNTYIDEHSPIIQNRAKYYYRHAKHHRLYNAPHVNCSNKVTGGGILSNVIDMCTFGNIVSQCFQRNPVCTITEGSSKVPYVTDLREFLKPQLGAVGKRPQRNGYGLGFAVNGAQFYQGDDLILTAGAPETEDGVFHSGNGCGASSQLLVRVSGSNKFDEQDVVVVALLSNLYEVNLEKPAEDIAALFTKTLR